MSIAQDIAQIADHMQQQEHKQKAEQIQDLRMLMIALYECKSAREVLSYLYVELTTKRRDSILQRIYGHYRTRLPIEEKQFIFNYSERPAWEGQKDM